MTKAYLVFMINTGCPEERKAYLDRDQATARMEVLEARAPEFWTKPVYSLLEVEVVDADS